MKPSVLYISYDGMLEPLGQSQVLAYLERLSGDYDIHLLSFEKPGDLTDKARSAVLRQRIADAAIHWTSLRYHSRPSGPATAYDIVRGILVGCFQAWRHGVRIVHARSYVASVMALVVKRLSGARFVFDMRGFWADERVDGGLWAANSRMYRMAKGFEKRFFLAADAVVSLTGAGAREIRTFDYLESRVPPITVIPTCANLAAFQPRRAPLPDPFVLGYVGSIGTWYLFDEFLACFKTLKQLRPDARLLIVNRNEHASIAEQISGAGIDAGDAEIVAADHQDVPKLISRMTAGTALIKPVYSKIASAPTKLAEFLGSGIPCLGNSDVGDMTEILEGERVGIVLREFDAGSRRQAMEGLIELTRDPEIPERCVAVAQKHFSLLEGVERYAGIYNDLIEG